MLTLVLQHAPLWVLQVLLHLIMLGAALAIQVKVSRGTQSRRTWILTSLGGCLGILTAIQLKFGTTCSSYSLLDPLSSLDFGLAAFLGVIMFAVVDAAPRMVPWRRWRSRTSRNRARQSYQRMMSPAWADFPGGDVFDGRRDCQPHGLGDRETISLVLGEPTSAASNRLTKNLH